MIRVKKEPDYLSSQFRGVLENCHFCKKKTKYWHERTNNPVCCECAPNHKVGELPDYGKEIRKRKKEPAG